MRMNNSPERCLIFIKRSTDGCSLPRTAGSRLLCCSLRFPGVSAHELRHPELMVLHSGGHLLMTGSRRQVEFFIQGKQPKEVTVLTRRGTGAPHTPPFHRRSCLEVPTRQPTPAWGHFLQRIRDSEECCQPPKCVNPPALGASGWCRIRTNDSARSGASFQENRAKCLPHPKCSGQVWRLPSERRNWSVASIVLQLGLRLPISWDWNRWLTYQLPWLLRKARLLRYRDYGRHWGCILAGWLPEDRRPRLILTSIQVKAKLKLGAFRHEAGVPWRVKDNFDVHFLHLRQAR